MSTQLAGFQSFLMFLHHFVLAKLATSSIRVDIRICAWKGAVGQRNHLRPQPK